MPAASFGHMDRVDLPSRSLGFEQDDRLALRHPCARVPADIGDVLADLPREDALERDVGHGLPAGQDPLGAAVAGDRRT